MGRGLPATFLGTQQKEWGCGVTSQPRGQTANSRNPPRHAKQEGGNEPLPPRGSRGAAGQPPPHPLAALSTYWLSSLAACKERERGTAPPRVRSPTVGTRRGWESIGPPRGGSGGCTVPMGCGRTAAHRQTDTRRTLVSSTWQRGRAPQSPRSSPPPWEGTDKQPREDAAPHGETRWDGGAAP